MTYAVEFEVPGDEALYGRVKDAIGVEHPAGLLVHMVGKTAAGLRHIEVWNSIDEHERFHRDRVEPAVHAVLQSIGLTETPPPHDHVILDLIDVQGHAARLDVMTLVRGISHVAIVTTDLDRLASFYVDLFGATVIQVDDTPFGRVGIVRLGAGTGLNLFEITDNEHAGGRPTMFDRGHLDHFGFDVADAAAFWTLRDRLIAGGHSTGDVTDFVPVIGLDFTDPDGMVGEVNFVRDPTLTGGHPPVPYDTTSTN